MNKVEMINKMLEDWAYRQEYDLYYVMSRDSNDNNIKKSFEEKIEELKNKFNIEMQFIYIETIELQDYYREYFCLCYIDDDSNLHSERIIFFERDEDF